MTIYNTGPELKIMHLWLAETYNQATRSYGYYDDVKCDLKVMQFATNGELVQTMTFTDCTIYNLGGLNFSYAPATEAQTFTIALNYFGYMLETEHKFFEGIFSQKSPMSDDSKKQEPLTNEGEIPKANIQSPISAEYTKPVKAAKPLKSKTEEEDDYELLFDEPLSPNLLET